jgi:hypothetical protein
VLWLREDVAMRDVLIATACLLTIVFLAGTGAYLIFGPDTAVGGLNPKGLIDHFGAVGDVLVSPFARWDSAWYMTAAQHGYGEHLPAAAPAFFPLYPLLIAIFGALGPGDLLAAVMISIVSLLVGLRMVWLLTNLEFGERYPEAPRLAVFLIALFPSAFFLTAVYPESLLLALSASAFWMARHGRWAWAGLLGGLAAASHSLGALLIVPLGLLYLREHHWWRLRFDVLWLALVPAGYGAFMAYLGLRGMDPLSPLTIHEVWLRHFTGPFKGTWLAIESASAGLRQLVQAHTYPIRWPAASQLGFDPNTASRDNVELFIFLVLAVVTMIGAFRRLPLAYGAYIAVVVIVAVSYPIEAQPLAGFWRYLAVVFPVQMVVARWLATHKSWRLPVLGLSACALAYYAAYFATWHFVG